jgi:Peptidase family M28
MDDYREQMAYDQTKLLAQWTRFVGSDGESKAKRHIFGQFTQLGIECRRQPFKCSAFLTTILLPIGLLLMGTLLLISAYFFWQSEFLIALIVALILLVVLFVANSLWTGSPVGSKYGKQYDLENLIGHMHAKNPRPKRTVVLMSHYDTKSQTYPVILRIVLFVVSAIGSLTVVLLYLIGAIVYLATSVVIFNGTVLFILAGVFAVCDFLLLFNRTDNKSVGATDNAAAVGVQIAIIRDLLDFPPENTDVYFLSTSAEELGLYGAIAFINQYEKDFSKDFTYFLNFDVIGGAGQILLHTKYGIPPKTTSIEINKILLEIAKEKNLPVGTQWLPIGATADHLPILKRGFKTTWIQTGDRKVTTKIHTTKDNIDLLTKESLRTAIILGFEFIQRIDKKP